MNSSFETQFDQAFDNIVGLYHIASNGDKAGFQKLVSVLMSLKQCLSMLEQGQFLERTEHDVTELLKLARTQLEQLQPTIKKTEYDKIMGHFQKLEAIAKKNLSQTR